MSPKRTVLYVTGVSHQRVDRELHSGYGNVDDIGDFHLNNNSLIIQHPFRY